MMEDQGVTLPHSSLLTVISYNTKIHRCKITGTEKGTGQRAFGIFQVQKKKYINHQLQIESMRSQQHLRLLVRYWTVFYLMMAEVIIY